MRIEGGEGGKQKQERALHLFALTRETEISKLTFPLQRRNKHRRK